MIFQFQLVVKYQIWNERPLKNPTEISINPRFHKFIRSSAVWDMTCSPGRGACNNHRHRHHHYHRHHRHHHHHHPYYHPPTHNHHLCWSTRWGGSILGRLVCTCREEPKGDLRDDDDGLWLWWYRWRFWLIFCPLQNFENLKMETFLWLYGFIVCYFCVGSPSIAGRHVFSTGSQMSTKDWKMAVTLVHHQFQFNVKMVKHKCPPRP